MPAASLHLISLQPSASISEFVSLVLTSSPTRPVVVARALRWIISPWMRSASATERAAVDDLASTSWDVLLIFPSVVSALPDALAPSVSALYTLDVGIPSRILSGFAGQNDRLLHPSSPPPPLTGSLEEARLASTSRDLELTRDILDWFSQPAAAPRAAPRAAVSMLNLLTMEEGKLESYKAYGRAFAADVGKRRGGLAKIVGPVIGKGAVWDEIALAHYPTVWHFADMVSSRDYQKANSEHRIGALRGTAILCCDELDPQVQEGIRNAERSKPKI